MYLQILNGASATSAAPRARAFGTIQDVAKASHVDTEIVTIHDGFAARVFEYDVTGNGVTAGRVSVDISGATDAASVGVILAAAINAATHTDSASTPFAVTAVHVGSGLVYLWCDNFGTIGNQTITEGVADAGYTVSGMSGALDGVPLGMGTVVGDQKQGFNVGSLDDLLFVLTSRSGSGTMTFAGTLWSYQEVPGLATPNLPIQHSTSSNKVSLPPGIWAPHGIAGSLDTDRGKLNNGVAVAESFSLADLLTFQQSVGNMRHASRALCQITTLGGTAPIVDAWLKARG